MIKMNWRIVLTLGIAAELIFGLFLGFVFLERVAIYEESFHGTYFKSILKYYGVIRFLIYSLMYCILVWSIGIISAFKLNLSRRIYSAILCSFLSWFLFFFIYFLTYCYFTHELKAWIIPILLILVSLVLGFNYGLIVPRRSNSE